MELTWTDAVFSRIALVLFLCRNQSSSNVLKIYGEQFWKISKISAPSSTSGGGPVGQKPLLRHHPLVVVGKLVGPTRLCRPQSQVYKIPFVPEKIKNRSFRRFCDTEAPPPPVLHLEGRSGVRPGLRRGNPSPSSSSTILPHHFHDAHRRA